MQIIRTLAGTKAGWDNKKITSFCVMSSLVAAVAGFLVMAGVRCFVVIAAASGAAVVIPSESPSSVSTAHTHARIQQSRIHSSKILTRPRPRPLCRCFSSLRHRHRHLQLLLHRILLLPVVVCHFLENCNNILFVLFVSVNSRFENFLN